MGCVFSKVPFIVSPPNLAMSQYKGQEDVVILPSSSTEYDYLFKILIVGDSGVGKSSLLLRFADDTYTDSFISTVGVDFKIRTMTIDGKVIKFQLWDTAGQERYRTITHSYYRGAHGIIVVYAINNLNSFNNLPMWLDDVQQYAQKHAQKLLVGTKYDLNEQRQVSEMQASQFAQACDLQHLESSAKCAYNVDQVFINMAKIIIARLT